MEKRTGTFYQVFADMMNYLLCTTTGEVAELNELIEWSEGVTAQIHKTGHRKILFDNRDFRLKLSSWDIITFAKRLEDESTTYHELRLAVLSSPFNPEISRVAETSLTNRSATYMRFDTEDEALAWLGR